MDFDLLFAQTPNPAVNRMLRDKTAKR